MRIKIDTSISEQSIRTHLLVHQLMTTPKSQKIISETVSQNSTAIEVLLKIATEFSKTKRIKERT